ncbi:hypothetical protein DTW90_23930 [Neorhizobium sp. P12A]|nr:hypothetical protein DTW90_23930 [Neorhizobium sp. P12A]
MRRQLAIFAFALLLANPPVAQEATKSDTLRQARCEAPADPPFKDGLLPKDAIAALKDGQAVDLDDNPIHHI